MKKEDRLKNAWNLERSSEAWHFKYITQCHHYLKPFLSSPLEMALAWDTAFLAQTTKVVPWCQTKPNRNSSEFVLIVLSLNCSDIKHSRELDLSENQIEICNILFLFLHNIFIHIIVNLSTATHHVLMAWLPKWLQVICEENYAKSPQLFYVSKTHLW